MDNTHTWEEIRNEIRNNVRHARVREWAMKCIEYCDSRDGNAVTVNSTYISTICTCMSYFLKDSHGDCLPVTFVFDSDSGEAKGYFKYRTINNTVPQNNNGWSSYGTILSTPVEEDVGDMLKSNYIII